MLREIPFRSRDGFERIRTGTTNAIVSRCRGRSVRFGVPFSSRHNQFPPSGLHHTPCETRREPASFQRGFSQQPFLASSSRSIVLGQRRGIGPSRSCREPSRVCPDTPGFRNLPWGALHVPGRPKRSSQFGNAANSLAIQKCYNPIHDVRNLSRDRCRNWRDADGIAIMAALVSK